MILARLNPDQKAIVQQKILAYELFKGKKPYEYVNEGMTH